MRMSQTSGTIALVGRPNVGKSTLLNALVGEAIAITSPHPQTTRDVVRGVLTAGDAQYQFVDTPGLHQARSRLGNWMNEVARQALCGADAAALVVEPTVDEGGLALARGLRDLTAAPSVLVINKVDRIKDKSTLLPVIAAFADAHPFVATVPVSAARRDGLDRLLAELRPLLPHGDFPWDPDALSDQPVRSFVAEFVREQVLAHTRQEVPHGVAVTVDRFEEGQPVAHIELTVHVAREAHKKILVGAGGEMVRRIGTAARARVERLLGQRVHLQLWVRTTPDWMNDPAKLKELGYGDASTAPGPREEDPEGR
jgi:GTP-binding protein Era